LYAATAAAANAQAARVLMEANLTSDKAQTAVTTAQAQVEQTAKVVQELEAKLNTVKATAAVSESAEFVQNAEAVTKSLESELSKAKAASVTAAADLKLADTAAATAKATAEASRAHADSTLYAATAAAANAQAARVLMEANLTSDKAQTAVTTAQAQVEQAAKVVQELEAKLNTVKATAETQGAAGTPETSVALKNLEAELAKANAALTTAAENVALADIAAATANATAEAAKAHADSTLYAATAAAANSEAARTFMEAKLTSDNAQDVLTTAQNELFKANEVVQKLEAELNTVKNQVSGTLGGAGTPETAAALKNLEAELATAKAALTTAAENVALADIAAAATKATAELAKLKADATGLTIQIVVFDRIKQLLEAEINKSHSDIYINALTNQIKNIDAEVARITAELVTNKAQAAVMPPTAVKDLSALKQKLEAELTKKQALQTNKQKITVSSSSVDASDLFSRKPKLGPDGKPIKNDESHLTSGSQWTIDLPLRSALGIGNLGRNRGPVATAVQREIIGKAVSQSAAPGFNKETKETLELLRRAKKQRKAIAKALKPAIGLVEVADEISDYLDIFTTFMADSFFYEVFPDITTLLNPETLEQVRNASVKLQIDRMTQYNTDNKTKNINSDAPASLKDPNKLFPLISGPLDAVDMDIPQANQDPYWNQVRITTEIDAVKLRLLRDTSTSHYTKMLTKLGGADVYTYINSDSTDSLVNYVFMLDTVDKDQLMREAYANVCAFHGGVVYEDMYPSSDLYWQGRPRFQCGYKNKIACNNRADIFAKGVSRGGNYGEWYSFAEVDQAISNLSTTTLTSPITACSNTASTYQGACSFSSINLGTGFLPTSGRLAIAAGGSGFTLNATCNVRTVGNTSGKIQVQVNGSGSISSIVSVTQGSGYTSVPNLDFSECGAGTGASISGLGIKTSATGICLISSMSPRIMCEDNQGIWDTANRRCKFTEEYCRSIGTCYTDDSYCALPPETMESLSYVFGNATPREWIRINGCKANSQNIIESLLLFTPLALFTRTGQTFYSDMVNNHKNWGEGLKHTLSDPMAATMLAQMAMFTRVGDIVVSAGLRAGVRATAGEVAAQAVPRLILAEKYALFGSRAGVMAGARVSGNAILFVLFMIATGIEIGVSFAKANLAKNRQIPDPKDLAVYASNYTVGGWKDGDPQQGGKFLGFAEGWVTKPIPMHPTTAGTWPPPAGSSVTLPGRCMTFNQCNLGALSGKEDFYTDRAGVTDSVKFRLGNVRQGIETFLGAHESVGKQTCHGQNKIWAGGSSLDDVKWCMDPFPGDIYTDTQNIGPLAPVTSEFVTSNTWTDGSDFYTAQYPMTAVAAMITDPDYRVKSDYWYYQLSYDKNNMIGMNGQLSKTLTITNAGTGYTSGPCNLTIGAPPQGGSRATGTAIINNNGTVGSVSLTYPGYGYTSAPSVSLQGCGGGTGANITASVSEHAGYPKNLWNTSLLQVYFTDSTINSMRMHYCTNSLKDFVDGSSVDPKCWGYLNVLVNSYKFTPMTSAGRKF
jgi:hypothetical protein